MAECVNCSVCLEVMRDPVTIPCGHSYCMSCIKQYWDKEDFKTTRCPQCRQDFSTPPALNKNTMLAEIIEQLQNTTVQSPPPLPPDALPPLAAAPALASSQSGEVECDFCTYEKLRAVRSCLECRASYCQRHLQQHYEVPALRTHTLVTAIILQTCPRHNKLLEAFCRTDNTCICMSCVMDEHKGHDVVSSAEERDQKEATVRDNKLRLVEKRKEKEDALSELRKNSQAHTQSIQELVEETEEAFNSIITSLKKSCSEVTERIRAQEEVYNHQSAVLQEHLECDICILMGQEETMDKVLQTEDNIQFLQSFENMPTPSGAAEKTPQHTVDPAVSFRAVKNMVSEFKSKLEVFSEEETNTMIAKFIIKVGDRVRVKSSVNKPKYNWGCNVSHRSVGVVTAVNDDTVIVDFLGHNQWKGLLSEMETVTADEESALQTIKVGDRVRVKPSVNSPRCGWGKVTHRSVGVVKSLCTGMKLIVDFPEYSGWNGFVNEMEIVA